MVTTVTTLPKRNEVPEEMTWDATSIYSTADEWQAANKKVLSDIEKLGKYEGKLGKSAAPFWKG